ncbi:hypothetical protein H5410_015342 [Solanum commersonii]|uniref:Uncharacterized protein n=1 Tax=Solanum commersonii TaxID=4109 RepID=A0A9J5ZTE8_SOLCO|nr:hypothetical protein H5410_015342 [Solanum commersonii]
MEVHLRQPPKTRGVKRKILTDVENALQTVDKIMPSTDQIEDGHVHEPQGIFMETLDQHQLINWGKNCTYYHALRFEYEPPTFCCTGGCINLATNEVANDIYELFVADSKNVKLFRKNIRAHNSIFAFTSFRVKLDKALASSRKGVYNFKAQGQIYHDLPSLIPNNNRPRYFQQYFYDTDHELANRMSVLQDANLSEENSSHDLKNIQTYKNLQICIAVNASLDQRVCNKPLVDQVEAIWVDGNNPNTPFRIDIVVHKHSGKKHREKEVGIKEYRNVANRSTTTKIRQIQVWNRQDYHPQLLLGCWPMKHMDAKQKVVFHVGSTTDIDYKYEQNIIDSSNQIIDGRYLKVFLIVSVLVSVDETG